MSRRKAAQLAPSEQQQVREAIALFLEHLPPRQRAYIDALAGALDDDPARLVAGWIADGLVRDRKLLEGTRS